jgi:hypothetical protein
MSQLIRGSGRAGPSPRRSSTGQPGRFIRPPEGPRSVPRPVSGEVDTRPVAIYLTSPNGRYLSASITPGGT